MLFDLLIGNNKLNLTKVGKTCFVSSGTPENIMSPLLREALGFDWGSRNVHNSLFLLGPFSFPFLYILKGFRVFLKTVVRDIHLEHV